MRGKRCGLWAFAYIEAEDGWYHARPGKGVGLGTTGGVMVLLVFLRESMVYQFWYCGLLGWFRVDRWLVFLAVTTVALSQI